MRPVTSSVVDCTSESDPPPRSQVVDKGRNLHQFLCGECQHAALGSGKVILNFELENLHRDPVTLAAVFQNCGDPNHLLDVGVTENLKRDSQHGARGHHIIGRPTRVKSPVPTGGDLPVEVEANSLNSLSTAAVLDIATSIPVE
jgi:hypothetical protein